MRPKGLKKTGGRRAGKTNKSTTELRNIFQALLEANIETMQKDLNSLESKDRLQIIFKMATFCLPTLQSQNIELNNRAEEDAVIKRILYAQK